MDFADKKILIVDDEVDLLELLVLELELLGFTVESAQNYDSAVGKFAAARFDFVITDIRMPGKGGMELLQIARQANPGGTVILMTGFADISLETCMNAGAVARLDKPFTRADLRGVLHTHAVSGEGLWQVALPAAPALQWSLSSEAAHARVGQGGISFVHDLEKAETGESVAFTVAWSHPESLTLAGSGVVQWRRSAGNQTWYGLRFAGLSSTAVEVMRKLLQREPTDAFIPAGV